MQVLSTGTIELERGATLEFHAKEAFLRVKGALHILAHRLNE